MLLEVLLTLFLTHVGHVANVRKQPASLRSDPGPHHRNRWPTSPEYAADSRTGEILKQFSRQNHQTAFPLTVEFRGEDAPFSDSRCTENAHLFPFNILSIDYSIDGDTEQHAFLNEAVHLEARQYVDVSIRYCDVPRVQAFVGGRPYKLSCEYQEQYIANDSKCARIQVESAQQSYAYG